MIFIKSGNPSIFGGKVSNTFLLDKLTTVFVNTGSSPIDVFWLRGEGDEVVYNSNVLPTKEVQEDTYLSHSWIFKVSGTNIRLNARANGYESSFFKALDFGVTSGVNFEDVVVRVEIAEGKLKIVL